MTVGLLAAHLADRVTVIGELVHETSDVLRARTAFLSGDERPAAVRPEILASWRRSALLGAQPDVPALPFRGEIDSEDPLHVAARPVLDRLAGRLDRTRTAMLLADRDARITMRWVGDPGLLRLMDRTDSAPGFALREEACGTNGLGSVLEVSRPFSVVGPEHFADRFQEYACYGAPIRHPVSGRLEGVLTFMSRAAEASPLMLAFIEETAACIQERMLTTGSRRERLLVDAFVTAERRTLSPVIALNEQTIVASAATSALLEQGLGHATLWQVAREAIAGRVARMQDQETLCGEGDRAFRVTVSPVLDGTRVVGALVHLSDPTSAGPSAASHSGRSVHPQQCLLRHLGGQSRAWVHAMSVAAPAVLTHHPVLLLGEPGAGKLEVAQALHELSGVNGPLVVFNAALAVVDGFAVWLGKVRTQVGRPGTLVLTHLETLTGTQALALAALLDEHEGTWPRLIGTATRHCGEAPPAGPHLDRLAVHRVDLPSLRERSGDVPELVKRLARRHGDDRLLFSSEAMRALADSPWPGNVRQLETLVRRLAANRRPDVVGLQNLPADLVCASQHGLTALQRLQLEAIMAALAKSGSNVKLAAAELGVSRSTLYRWLHELHIDLNDPARVPSGVR
jgi:sigma-54 dependent transcriptional regulator, acetoin dehydrogenase operon transcriptional activator AcoR